MFLNFANLSSYVFGGICKLSSEETLAQLRQVSKSTNEQVCYLVKLLKTDIECISFLYDIHSCEPQQLHSLLFIFNARKSFFMWKLCLVHMVNENINNNNITLRINLDNNSIRLLFVPESAKTALQSLKPFVLQAIIDELYVTRSVRSEILDIFLDLVAEKSFKEIVLLGHYHEKTFDFVLWTAWIRKIRTTKVDFDPLRSLNGDAVHLINSAANVSSSLNLMFDIPISMPMVLAIVHGVLSTQCGRLKLSIDLRSLQDYKEKLIQLFHHYDKKFEFVDTNHTTRFPMDFQVGIYRVKQDRYGYSIKHLEKEL